MSNDGDVTGHHGTSSTTDGWIVKLSSSGTVQWEKSIGGSGNDEFDRVIRTADDGYICVGFTTSTDGDVSGNHGGEDVWVVKLDAYGNIQWQKCLGGTATDYGSDIVQTVDGKYTLIGTVYSTDGDVTGNHGGYDGWVVRLDGAGNLLWQSCYGSSDVDNGYSIAALADGEYLVGFQGDSPAGSFAGLGGGAGNNNGYILKIDGTGNILQGKWIASFNYGAYGLQEPDNSHFYTLSGVQSCVNNDGFQVQQFDTSFNQVGSIDNYAYCGPNYYPFYAAKNSGNMTLLGSGGGVLAGQTADAGIYTLHGGNDALLANFGAHTWGKVYGGSGDEYFRGIVSMDDYDFIVAGYTNSTDGDVSGNHGGYDFWVVRLSHFNTVHGTVYLDYNKNGTRDSGEPLVNNILVQSSGGGINSGSSTVNGVYDNVVDTGTYTTSVLSSVPYYTAVPASHTSTFAAYDLSDSFSFALQPVPGQRDYSVNLYTTRPARPGDSIVLGLLYMNQGTDTLNGRTVRLVKDHRLQYLSALPAAASVSGDTLSWTVSGLAPRDTGAITIYTKAMTPPALGIGDTLLSTAWIDTTGDLAPGNNTFSLKQTVFSSYDPNGKTESYDGYADSTQLAKGGYLQYTINFQNTGNDTAFNISITDTLSSKLDVTSFEMVGASAPYQLTTRNGNILTWTFSSILLPDSSVNGPGSHGYIVYRVKPAPGFHKGDSILNGAGIYFDFNPVVPTNQQKTIITAVTASRPPAPVISGLRQGYCQNVGTQTITIANMPQAQSGIAVSASIDTVAVTVAPGATFALQPGTLRAGTHRVTVIFSNIAGADTTTQTFLVDSAVTPVVRLSSSVAGLSAATPTLELRAAAVSGGGDAPVFVFATDGSFTHVLSGPGASDSMQVDTTMLVAGANTLYVRMQTSDTCYTVQTATDSVGITFTPQVSSGGGKDTTAMAPGANPNPFRDQLTVVGLQISDSYFIQLLNSQGMSVRSMRAAGVKQTLFYTGNVTTGVYLLRIYDETSGRVLRSVQLLALGNN